MSSTTRGMRTLVFFFAAVLPVTVRAANNQLPFNGFVSAPPGYNDLTFRLYNAPSGGAYLGYSTSQSDVWVYDDGSFSAMLVVTQPNLLAANPSVFIAIESTFDPGTEIGGRVPIYASGYAIAATTLTPSATITGGTPAYSPTLTVTSNVPNHEAGYFYSRTSDGITPVLRAFSDGPGTALVASTSGVGECGKLRHSQFHLRLTNTIRRQQQQPGTLRENRRQ